MPSVTNYISGAANDTSSGSIAWTNLTNFVARTGAADASIFATGTTYYLEGALPAMGIPGGSTVVGVAFTFTLTLNDLVNTSCSGAYLVNGGSSRTSPNNRAVSGPFSAGGHPFTCGGPTDLMGGSAATILSDANAGILGLAIAFTLGSGGTVANADISDMSGEVFYTGGSVAFRRGIGGMAGRRNVNPITRGL